MITNIAICSLFILFLYGPIVFSPEHLQSVSSVPGVEVKQYGLFKVGKAGL